MGGLPPLPDNPFDKHVAPGLVTASEAGPRRPHRYGNRFTLAFAALAALVGAAVAGLVLTAMLGDSDDRPTEPRSAVWAPSRIDTAGRLREIAEHVSNAYRIDQNRAFAPTVAGLPGIEEQGLDPAGVAVLAARTRRVDGRKRIDFDVLPRGSAFFQLCATIQPDDCGLPPPTSPADLPGLRQARLLARRQGLDLALNALHHIPEIRAVVISLPPQVRAATPQPTPFIPTLFVERSDLAKELAAPLSATLPGDPPTLASIAEPELTRVDRLTAPLLYTFGGIVRLGVDDSLAVRLFPPE